MTDAIPSRIMRLADIVDGAPAGAVMNVGVAMVPRTVGLVDIRSKDRVGRLARAEALNGEQDGVVDRARALALWNGWAQRSPAERPIVAAALRDLGGRDYATITTRMATHARLGSGGPHMRGPDLSDARALVAKGRRDANRLGLWPWAHCTDGCPRGNPWDDARLMRFLDSWTTARGSYNWRPHWRESSGELENDAMYVPAGRLPPGTAARVLERLFGISG